MRSESFSPVLPAFTTRAGSDLFGAQYSGLMPATAGFIQHVLTNPQIEGLPSPITVHLFRPSREPMILTPEELPADQLENAEVRAIVSYSSGATHNSFKCDWDAQFTLVCSQLTIAFETYAPFATIAMSPYTGIAYRAGTRKRVFGALIGMGAGASGGSDSVGYTSSSGLCDEAGSHQGGQLIPDFARRYFPFVQLNNARPTEEILSQLEVQIRNSNGYCIACYPLTQHVLLQGVPLPGSAALLAVVSSDSESEVQIVHHFKLGL